MSAPETLPAAEPVVVTSEVKEELPCDIATLKTFEFDRILSEGESLQCASLVHLGSLNAEASSDDRAFHPSSQQANSRPYFSVPVRRLARRACHHPRRAHLARHETRASAREGGAREPRCVPRQPSREWFQVDLRPALEVGIAVSPLRPLCAPYRVR